MCLENLYSKEQIETFKKRKPKEFYVYKCVDYFKGIPEFFGYFEDDFSKAKVVKAGIFDELRKPLYAHHVPYIPGFHVFFTIKDAKKYQTSTHRRLRVARFKAKREWVQDIGFVEKFQSGTPFNIRCGVLTHIRVLPKKDRIVQS